MDTPFRIVATTYAGLEKALVQELAQLGIPGAQAGRRMVAFDGDKRSLYLCNYRSRLALRFLKQLGTFTLNDQNDYYEAIKSLPWEDFILREQRIAIDAVVSGTLMTHSQFAAQRAKDSIVDRLKENFGWRPSVDLIRPDIRIHIHVNKNLCHVSLDSSGESLHKRGYRKVQGEAPLSEVMAAGIIHLSGWNGEGEFLDPMCGSGTIPIEAAMTALNIPAAFFRKSFSFLRWPDYDKKLWDAVKAEASAERKQAEPFIRASDASYKAIANAAANIASAGCKDIIMLEKKPFQAVFPRRLSGTIITNPPYDERIKIAQNTELYRSFGDILKKRFKGYTTWVFSGDLKALTQFGLRPSARIPLFNGPIECRLMRFDLFEGSLRDHKYGTSESPEASVKRPRIRITPENQSTEENETNA